MRSIRNELTAEIDVGYAFNNTTARPMMTLVLTLFCLLSCLGCGDSSDSRNIQIHGTVNLNGKPIKNGKISFTPDSQAGNKGPMGVAKIKEGKFTTDSLGGRGVVGGPHIVRIENHINEAGEKAYEYGEMPEGGESTRELVRRKSKNPLPKGHFEDWDIPIEETQIKRDFQIKN